MTFHDGSLNINRDYNMNGSYYLNSNDTALIHDYGTTTIFLRGTGSLLLRAGLILIQFGCVPSTNVNYIILHNVLDLSCATIAYGMLGNMLAFGHDQGGVVGWKGWILTTNTDIEDAVVGCSSVIAVSGIYTTMFSGRLHYVGCIFMTSLLSAVIIPVIMHWMWTSTGWMYKATFIQNSVSYKDHGGGLLIHVNGGIVALIGSLFLGRRLFKLEDIDEGSLTQGSPASTTVGYLLVIYGLMALCLPTPVYELTHEPMNYIGVIFFNNILAAAGSIITVVLLQFLFYKHVLLEYWTTLRYMQGAVAGIVTIASGVDVYSPYVALGLGISGGILFYIIAYFMFYSAIEDYANIIPTHLSCGFLGTLLPPLCGSREGFGVLHKIKFHLAWQVIGNLVVSVTMIVLTVLMFFFMKQLHLLRTEEDDKTHQRAMAALSSDPSRNYFKRLWGLKPDSFLLQPGCKAHKKKLPTRS